MDTNKGTWQFGAIDGGRSGFEPSTTLDEAVVAGVGN